jgi:hypothetical protein
MSPRRSLVEHRSPGLGPRLTLCLHLLCALLLYCRLQTDGEGEGECMYYNTY